MTKTIDYLGQIKHSSGYVFVVLFDLDRDFVIAHPKYDLRNGRCRISNPVDPNRNNKLEIEDTISFGHKDYLVNKKNIVEYYPCYGNEKKIREGTSKSKMTRDSVLELFDIFSQIIPRERIGVTGSLATGNASDGYSDIDIVLKESDFRELISSRIFLHEKIELRNKKQWVEFYNHYGIFCALDAEEFADAAQNKKQQFFYNGIPVSIFVDPCKSFLQLVNSLSENDIDSIMELKGRVLYENLVFLPGYMIVECGGRLVVVINFHRTYQNCLYKGDFCKVKAKTSSFQDLYIVYYDDECYIKRIVGDEYDK